MSTKSVHTKRLPKPKRLFWFKVWVIFLGLLAGGLGAATALFITMRPFQKKNPAIGTQESIINFASFNRPVNILILGTVVLSSDLPGAQPTTPPEGYLAQVDRNLEGQSDTILFVRFDPSNHSITVLSIPRDTLVDIPDLGIRKVNAANYVGGALLSAQTVSKLLHNITIDRYVRVNVAGFAKLIDALGGVEVYVPMDMKYQDDSQHLYINLRKGLQRLNGEKSIQFMRFRHDGLGDIGRVQRQQMFVRALADQKLNLETLKKVPEILGVIQENLDTNLSIQEMLSLVGFASQTKREDMQMLLLPGRFSTPEEYDVSYWITEDRHLKHLLALHFGMTEPYASSSIALDTPEYLRISIQDSIDRPEGILEISDKLSQSGYAQVFPAEAPWSKPLSITQVVAQSGDREAATKVQRLLGVGEVVLEATGDIESDITIRIGKDWRAKQPNPVKSLAPVAPAVPQ